MAPESVPCIAASKDDGAAECRLETAECRGLEARPTPSCRNEEPRPVVGRHMQVRVEDVPIFEPWRRPTMAR